MTKDDIRALSEEQLCDMYLANGWQDPGNHSYPDPVIADEIRAMLLAPTVEDAANLIEYWGWLDRGELEGRVINLRLLAGIGKGTLVEKLRQLSLPLAHEAADEIERLQARSSG